MDTLANRIHTNIYALFITLGIALYINYFTGQNILKNAVTPLIIADPKVVRFGIGQSKNEVAAIKLRLLYDFRYLLNWSTTSIYIYVVAEYETPSHPVNEVIIHDEVITDYSNLVRDKTVICKYYLSDFARSLKKRNVTLKAYYWFFPIGGPFGNKQVFETSIEIPSTYTF